jgi:hypothetical protein
MIEIKRCNYFTGDVTDVASGVCQIVKFLEVDGRNYLLITPPRSNTQSKQRQSTNLKYSLSNQFTYENFDDFCKVLNNKSNLFRVNLLVFDFWHLSHQMVNNYKKEIDKLNLDHIIVTKEYYYKTSDDVNDFQIRTEYKDLHKSDTWITDNINKSTVTLDSLKTSYIRDKKIDNLFNDEE